jgi:hypothetical protein
VPFILFIIAVSLVALTWPFWKAILLASGVMLVGALSLIFALVLHPAYALAVEFRETPKSIIPFILAILMIAVPYKVTQWVERRRERLPAEPPRLPESATTPDNWDERQVEMRAARDRELGYIPEPTSEGYTAVQSRPPITSIPGLPAVLRRADRYCRDARSNDDYALLIGGLVKHVRKLDARRLRLLQHAEKARTDNRRVVHQLHAEMVVEELAPLVGQLEKYLRQGQAWRVEREWRGPYV